MVSTRRAFLRALGAAAAAIGITRYAEPELLIPDVHHDWIEDRGDFYVVRVPDFKTFANETLNKPTIFLLGQESTMKYVEVNSYANIAMGLGASVLSSRFDSSKAQAGKPRATVNVNVKADKHGQISGCQFLCGEWDEAAVRVQSPPAAASLRGNRGQQITTRGVI